ncbi:DUF1801 domain-containing protein [Niabella hibiscisoli]|nr:DUF1801 domain-containing protein [Niabella hibiscisoli]MCH5719714.1 DUF1801 domain-containing protein [Niabella hibiscisoli]
MNPKVDFFFDKDGAWQSEFLHMRELALDCGLAEELKWGQPCYCLGKANIILIHGFKEYCAILFFKGALLKDPERILIQQTENVQSARQLRFTSLKEVKQKAKAIRSYIYEAIEVEMMGLKVPLKKTEAFEVPDEFKEQLDKKPPLRKAFEALTPGGSALTCFISPRLNNQKQEQHG